MLRDIFKKTMFTGLGLAALTKERIESLVEEMIAEGDVSKEEGKELLDSWVRRAEFERDEMRRRIQSEVKKVLSGMGVASKAEVEDLKARIAVLEARFAEPPTEDSGSQQ